MTGGLQVGEASRRDVRVDRPVRRHRHPAGRDVQSREKYG